MDGRMLFVMAAAAVMLLTVSVPAPVAEGDAPLDLLDANITGKVENGTSGIKVSCQSVKTPTGTGSNPRLIYFNGTTNSTGHFNIAVDSNSTAEPPSYSLSTYTVLIESTYYLDAVKESHTFDTHIEMGDVFQVPDGVLEVTSAVVGDLTVRIINKTSGAPLEGASVTIDHDPGTPDIPFTATLTTDSSGEVEYTDVRAEEVIVEATRENFLDLSSTVAENNGMVIEGTTTVLQFNLTERPWPFTTDPPAGSTSANVTEGIEVDFGTEMDPASITSLSNYDLETGSGFPVSFSVQILGTENDTVSIVPDEPLEYDSDYVLYIYPSIRSLGGWELLWRTMDVPFHTELKPGIVRGRIIEEGTSEPVSGIEVELVDQVVRTDPDGSFEFPLVIDGVHDLEVEASYLFGELSREDISVKRGDVIDLGNLTIGALPHGSMRIFVTSGGEPLEGAWVKVLSSEIHEDEFNLTTNSTGVAYFQRVRSGNVNLRIGADHHSSKIDIAIVPEGGTGNLTVDLVEDDPPVEVRFTQEISPGVADPSSDFLLIMPEPVDFSTLQVNLWRLIEGERDSEISLSPPQTGSENNSYLIRVQGQLPQETEMELVVDDGLLALDDGEPVLWEDIVHRFSTPQLPVSNIVGTVYLEGRPLEGLEVDFKGQKGFTDNEGNLNMTFDPSNPTEAGMFTVNMTGQGYSLYREEISVSAGTVFEIGTVSLIPVEGYYEVSPAYGAYNIDPDTNITFTFSVEPETPDDWSVMLKIVKKGMSAPIQGTYTADGNMTVVFDPDLPLEMNTHYNVIADDDLMQKGGLKMFPVGNTSNFKTAPPALEIEVLEPEVLDDVALDAGIRLSFGVSVNRTLIEEAVDINPAADGIGFQWISGSEVVISAMFSGSEDYTLSIAAGVYGEEDEPLVSQFVLSFSTGTGYDRDHSFTSINLIPEPEGWETGQTVTISGTVDNSRGYEIVVTLGEFEWTSTVNEDGTWSVEIVLPGESVSGTLKVSVGVSGGPEAHSKEYEVDVREPEEVSEEDDEDLTVYFIIGAVVLIILVIIAGLFFMRAQKKKAEEEMDIEITEVEGEWEE